MSYSTRNSKLKPTASFVPLEVELNAVNNLVRSSSLAVTRFDPFFVWLIKISSCYIHKFVFAFIKPLIINFYCIRSYKSLTVVVFFLNVYRKSLLITPWDTQISS